MASIFEFLPSDRPSEFDSSSGAFAELLARARRGSDTSLGELLESTRKYLLTVAEQKLSGELRCKVAASDVVQDTFVEAHKDFVRFRGTTERELLAWLSATLIHRVLDTVRRYRSTQKRSLEREAGQDHLSNIACGALTPKTNLIALEERQRVQRVFARLPEQVRNILIMRIWQRSSFAEIGERCNCSAEAARKRFLRAVEELRSALGHSGGD